MVIWRKETFCIHRLSPAKMLMFLPRMPPGGESTKLQRAANSSQRNKYSDSLPSRARHQPAAGSIICTDSGEVVKFYCRDLRNISLARRSHQHKCFSLSPHLGTPLCIEQCFNIYEEFLNKCPEARDAAAAAVVVPSFPTQTGYNKPSDRVVTDHTCSACV